METSLIGGFAAGLGIAAAACLPLLRRAYHTRQLRIRLGIPPVGRRARLGFDLLGLYGPDGPQNARHEPGTVPEVPSPQFWIHERRAGRMAPALLASAGLHAVLAASAPEAFLWLSRALDPQAVLVVHVEGAIRMPLTLQAPVARNVVMTNPGRKVQGGRARAGRAGAGAPSARRLVEPAIPGPGRRTEDLPAPPCPPQQPPWRRPDRSGPTAWWPPPRCCNPGDLPPRKSSSSCRRWPPGPAGFRICLWCRRRGRPARAWPRPHPRPGLRSCPFAAARRCAPNRHGWRNRSWHSRRRASRPTWPRPQRARPAVECHRAASPCR